MEMGLQQMNWREKLVKIQKFWRLMKNSSNLIILDIVINCHLGYLKIKIPLQVLLQNPQVTIQWKIFPTKVKFTKKISGADLKEFLFQIFVTFTWNPCLNSHLLKSPGCTPRTQYFNQFSASIFWNCTRKASCKKWEKNFSSNQFVINIIPMIVSISLLSKSCSWFWPLDQLWQFLCQFTKNFKTTLIPLEYFIRNILENIYMIYTSKLIFGFNFINKYFQWCTHSSYI